MKKTHVAVVLVEFVVFLLLTVITVMLSVSSCSSGPSAIPVTAATITAACANLAKLGCPEGGSSCAATIEHVSSVGVTDLKPACLATATSQEDARACGTVTCEVLP